VQLCFSEALSWPTLAHQKALAAWHQHVEGLPASTQASYAHATLLQGPHPATSKQQVAWPNTLFCNEAGPLFCVRAGALANALTQAPWLGTLGTAEGLAQGLVAVLQGFYQPKPPYPLPTKAFDGVFDGAFDLWQPSVHSNAYALPWPVAQAFHTPPAAEQEAIRTHLEATFGYTLSPAIPPQHATAPALSILIPFRDRPELLEQCLDSLLQHADHFPSFEVIGIDNQSTCQRTLALMQHYTAMDARIRFIEANIPFNYSTLNNLGAAAAKGEHLLLLNNDVEALSPHWLHALWRWSQHPAVGVVGGSLFYPDGRLQHGGCTLGLLGCVGHVFKFITKAKPEADVWGLLSRPRNVSAVTGACLMLKKSLYEAVGGLNEADFVIAYNDIDLSLKVAAMGLANVQTPWQSLPPPPEATAWACEAVHHESVSRKKGSKAPARKAQEAQERSAFIAAWGAWIEAGDPFYSPRLCHISETGAWAKYPHLRGVFEKKLLVKWPAGLTRWLGLANKWRCWYKPLQRRYYSSLGE
jgi:GT2 family glycosyltransferase